MACTALSVVHGTEISSFNAEVLDVIADDPAAGGARLLVRVSGPAIDATGVGPGFSGSPIICDGRYAGAISEGIGDYGNKVVLATPIEAILGARPSAAAGARKAPALLRAARPLTGPLVVSGPLGARARPAHSCRGARRPHGAGRPARAAGRLPAPGAGARRRGGRVDLHGGHLPGRRGHGRLPRRRPGLRLRARARRPRAPVAVHAGRLRVRRDRQPGRDPRPGRHDLQAHLVRRARARLGHQRHLLRDRGQPRRRPAGDPAAGDRPAARIRRAGDARLEPGRRAGPRAGRRAEPGRPAGGVDGARPAAGLDRARRPEGLHPLPRARAAQADRVLQSVLRQLQPAQRHRRGRDARRRLRPGSAAHPRLGRLDGRHARLRRRRGRGGPAPAARARRDHRARTGGAAPPRRRQPLAHRARCRSRRECAPARAP